MNLSYVVVLVHDKLIRSLFGALTNLWSLFRCSVSNKIAKVLVLWWGKKTLPLIMYHWYKLHYLSLAFPSIA